MCSVLYFFFQISIWLMTKYFCKDWLGPLRGLPNCLLAFSGGQDSTNLMIFYQIFFQSNFQKMSLIWCNSLWKTKDFSLFRHSIQISFLFYHRLYYTFFFFPCFKEEKARFYRYLFFRRMALYSQSNFVLTAHTQNDNIETFFIHLFRGSGKLGLQSLRNSQMFSNSQYLRQFF